MGESATWESSAGTEHTDIAAILMVIVENGIVAAILGAVVVAGWFLLLDMVTRGLPLYTPSLLGSIIFAGKAASEVTGVDEVAVFAYTGLHGILFLGAGAMLSLMFSQFERNPQVGMILLLLFITFEAILWGVGVSIIPELAGAVGAWAIVVGNVSSAAAMFVFLLRRHPRALESLRDTWQA